MNEEKNKNWIDKPFDVGYSTENNIEESSKKKELNESYGVIPENDETVLEKSETSAEIPAVTIQKTNENSTNRKRLSTFWVRMSFGIILALLAAFFIRPTSNSDTFYFFYFLLFIIFMGVVFFCCYLVNKNINDLQGLFEDIDKNKGRYSSLKSNNRKIYDICEAYKKSFLISDDADYHKTRSNSDLYFGSETWLQDMNYIPVQSFLKIIPGTFIGFGILGTFIGFADGLSSINIADSQSLLEGVQNLLDNLKYAFNTSIVGVLGSMFLNFIMIHPLFTKLDHKSKELCDYLDSKFFVTEVDAMAIIDENNQKKPFPVVLTEILSRLEGVSSNINEMGLTIGTQVTKSVKETLDKTIEKIIKAEIEQLKEDMKESIKLLKECQTSLQNAPQFLKEASINIENSAKNTSDVFKEFCDDIIDIKNAISLMPDDFKNVNNSFNSTIDKLSENQKELAKALSESMDAFNQATHISESLSKSYEEQTAKIEESISRFSDILSEYKETSRESKELIEGFKGLDEQIAKIFIQINENTQNYGKIIADSLENYFKGFHEATKDVSKQFADSTLALSEEVRRLNGASKA